MNDGYFVGRVTWTGGRPARDALVGLDYIEGSSEANVGRGVRGRERGIQIYDVRGRPYTGGDMRMTSRTNERGAFLVRFKWRFLGSDGVPLSIGPFYRAHGVVFSGVGARVRRVRQRARITNSLSTFAAYVGLNTPNSALGAGGMATDIIAILNEAGISTLPNPVVGQSTIDTQIMLAAWFFSVD